MTSRPAESTLSEEAIECVECDDGKMESVLLPRNGVYVPGRECDSCGATVRVVS